MANDFTGRVWRITAAGQTPFGVANVKFEGGLWTGMTAAGQTFTITDFAGRVYTFTSSGIDVAVNFFKFGWLSGPLTFGGTFTGEVDLFLGTK
jgi:hypothetical protein